MTEIKTHDQIVAGAYYLVARMLDATWSPKAKRELLEATAPYFEQFAQSEREAYRRSNDETLTHYERMVAGRDEEIINIAGGIVYDFMTLGLHDKRLAALLTPFQ